MEPQNKPSPEFQAPVPKSPEIAGEQLAPEKAVEKAPAPAAPERERQAGNAANQNQGAMKLPQVAPTPIPAPQAAPVVQDPQQPVIANTPIAAADTDVLEKEWLDKAKSIVKNARQDPRKQNTEVSHLKADYMQKRYGKIIKLPDDKA